MKGFIILLLWLCPCLAMSQGGWQAEVFTGVAAYSGDLNQSVIQPGSLRPAAHLNFKYDFGNQFYARAGFAWGMIAGDDKYNKRIDLQNRNLSFESHILEINLCLEYAIFPPDLFDQGWPYVFAGIGVFHFDPYAKDNNRDKVKLAPLSTEGEGLLQYPDRKPYNLTQFCIPFGGGFTLKLNDEFNLSAEIGFRKLFTDYLDDVSTTYPDATALYNSKGPLALQMSYRGSFSNIPSDSNPPGGTVRGNPGKKDWYYFAGLKLSWWLTRQDN